MKILPHTISLLAVCCAVAIGSPAARADDDWEDRREEFQERFEEQREDYEEFREDRAEALEEHWERQRELNRNQYRRHASYGNFGPYYAQPVVPNYYRAYRLPGTYAVPKPFAGYYDDCLSPRYYGDCGPYGGDCHNDVRGRLTIGPIRVFWD